MRWVLRQHRFSSRTLAQEKCSLSTAKLYSEKNLSMTIIIVYIRFNLKCHSYLPTSKVLVGCYQWIRLGNFTFELFTAYASPGRGFGRQSSARNKRSSWIWVRVAGEEWGMFFCDNDWLQPAKSTRRVYSRRANTAALSARFAWSTYWAELNVLYVEGTSHDENIKSLFIMLYRARISLQSF